MPVVVPSRTVPNGFKTKFTFLSKSELDALKDDLAEVATCACLSFTGLVACCDVAHGVPCMRLGLGWRSNGASASPRGFRLRVQGSAFRVLPCWPRNCPPDNPPKARGRIVNSACCPCAKTVVESWAGWADQPARRRSRCPAPRFAGHVQLQLAQMPYSRMQMSPNLNGFAVSAGLCLTCFHCFRVSGTPCKGTLSA